MIGAAFEDRRGLSLDFESLRAAYDRRTITVVSLIDEIYRRIAARGDDHVWTHLVPRDVALHRARDVERRGRGDGSVPLFGLPYGVKDNIDVRGLPTSAGNTAFAYPAQRSADVVERLDAAGAILIGKQSMDQFATGLVGIRSMSGFCRNAFSDEHIPGGSSSGSAVAVATGQVSFSIGSDTGGSGRVPAACNNVVGLKPTPGRVSTEGFVYCNRSFDAAPVFALTVDDAYDVLEVVDDGVGEVDRSTALRQGRGAGGGRGSSEVVVGGSGFSFGVPPDAQHEFFGEGSAKRLFDEAVDHLTALGGESRFVDLTPFFEAGAMLFDSALIAERWVSYGEVVRTAPDTVHPAVLASLRKAADYTAADAFEALYRLDSLKRRAARTMQSIDVLLLPTCATIPRWADVQADPMRLNSRMGRYTYFANPLQLCAIAVPAGFRDDGLPFGISLVGATDADLSLRRLAAAFHARVAAPLGATGHRLRTTRLVEAGPVNDLRFDNRPIPRRRLESS